MTNALAANSTSPPISVIVSSAGDRTGIRLLKLDVATIRNPQIRRS